VQPCDWTLSKPFVNLFDHLSSNRLHKVFDNLAPKAQEPPKTAKDHSPLKLHPFLRRLWPTTHQTGAVGHNRQKEGSDTEKDKDIDGIHLIKSITFILLSVNH